jgi:hypothetical protein
MIRASALYIVIVITLVIGIICSSLIVVAYFYREQYQRALRYDLLQNNLASGINILLADNEHNFEEGKTINLFGEDADSVALKTTSWGIFDMGMVKAFVGHDTLSKAFSMARAIDSAKWAALYLPDEDRPVSVSGKTTIKGNVFLPKSGVREAYVDGKAYQGDKRIIVGKTFSSQKTLPPLTAARIHELERYFSIKASTDTYPVLPDSLSRSFFEAPQIVSMGKKALSLDGIKLSGNIIIVSDTTVSIGGDSQLHQVMVYARYIKVKKGFTGICQLFASDSISVEPDCVFNYPSALGVLRLKPIRNSIPATLSIGSNVRFLGSIFAYDRSAERNNAPLINLGKKVIITGQIYSSGLLALNDETVISGSIFTNRFLYKSGITHYENYIINTTIDSKALSPYYLSSDIMPVAATKRKVLQWLESK